MEEKERGRDVRTGIGAGGRLVRENGERERERRNGGRTERRIGEGWKTGRRQCGRLAVIRWQGGGKDREIPEPKTKGLVLSVPRRSDKRSSKGRRSFDLTQPEVTLTSNLFPGPNGVLEDSPFN